MASIKEINIKNWTYYFFSDMINIKNFDSDLLKIDKSRTKVLIFIILICHHENSLYFTLDKLDG